MDAAQLITLASAATGVLFLTLGAFFARRAWRLARLVSSTPPTALAALDVGLHEVRGAVHGRGALTSPLAGRECLYWRFLLEQRRGGDWETLVDRNEAVPLWLDDGGGRVSITLERADVIVTAQDRSVGGIFGVPSSELTALLERLGEGPANLLGPFVRYREELFLDGDRLHAIGRAERDDEGGWRLIPDGDSLVLTDRDETEVVRFQERLAVRWLGLTAIGLGLVIWAIQRSL